jgi:hypothetical protein
MSNQTEIQKLLAKKQKLENARKEREAAERKAEKELNAAIKAAQADADRKRADQIYAVIVAAGFGETEIDKLAALVEKALKAYARSGSGQSAEA